MPEPLISCLMLTRATESRFPLIRKNLECYCNQTFPNRELVIVMDRPTAKDQSRLEREVDRLGRADIKVSSITKDWDMGMKRNATFLRSSGDILCQWDDDDFSHPRRLELQYKMLKNGDLDAVCLGELFWHDLPRKKLYLVNWAGGHPGTLMMKRPKEPPYSDGGAHYPKTGLSARGEDLILWNGYRANKRTNVLDKHPYLFIYHFHGTNLTNAQHHRHLMRLFCLPEAKAKKYWMSCKKKLSVAGLLPKAPLTSFREVTLG
jgi:glycosyltransferase involved in cell wall biosynthesis